MDMRQKNCTTKCQKYELLAAIDQAKRWSKNGLRIGLPVLDLLSSFDLILIQLISKSFNLFISDRSLLLTLAHHKLEVGQMLRVVFPFAPPETYDGLTFLQCDCLAAFRFHGWMTNFLAYRSTLVEEDKSP